MQLFAFGINHRTAPLTVRERVVFHQATLAQALRDLVARRSVKEAAIISTCNRTEIYCNTPEPEEAVGWFTDYHHLKLHALDPYLFTLPQEKAVRHAFRVASGLDSMVVGEPQILGQFKQAMRDAQQAGTIGWLLHKLFQRSFSVAKQVRSETDIGACSVSLAAAAVRLAERIFPALDGRSLLFIGAGEMIELCAAHFAAHGPKRVTFANRTLERGALLAARYHGQAILLNELPDQLASHDIIITSTASTLPILGKGMVERALKARKRRPLFMVDLAVPRDIEPEVAELDDVFLYSVDDLGKVVTEGLDTRHNAVNQAELIIDSGVQEFMHWLDVREMVPSIRALRDQADRMRRHELELALRRLAKGDAPQQVLEALSHGLTNKLLHRPSEALNRAGGPEREELARLLSRLYQIHRPE